jgi:hypothetical protein
LAVSGRVILMFSLQEDLPCYVAFGGAAGGLPGLHDHGVCEDRRVRTPPPPVAAVIGFIDAINRGDVDRLAALMSPDHRPCATMAPRRPAGGFLVGS